VGFPGLWAFWPHYLCRFRQFTMKYGNFGFIPFKPEYNHGLFFIDHESVVADRGQTSSQYNGVRSNGC